MVVDDALGIAGGARGVVERNRVPLVARRRALISFIALGDERLIVDPAEPFARTVVFRVVIVDDQRPALGQLQRRADHARKFAVDNERLGFAVVEHEGDRGRVEAGIERVEHGAAHRHAIVAFEHRGRVGEHDRDRVAADKAALRERGSELFRAGVELAVVATKGAMRDRQPIGKHRRRALEKGQRRQRLKVGGVAIEIAVIRRDGHRALTPMRFASDHSAPERDLARESAFLKGKRRRTESRQRSGSSLRRRRLRRTAAGSPASRRSRRSAPTGRRPNRPRN